MSEALAADDQYASSCITFSILHVTACHTHSLKLQMKSFLSYAFVVLSARAVRPSLANGADEMLCCLVLLLCCIGALRVICGALLRPHPAVGAGGGLWKPCCCCSESKNLDETPASYSEAQQLISAVGEY